MQARELWAAWILAALLVGLVAWVGHIEPRADGLTPASDVARRSPASFGRPPDEPEERALPRRGPPSGQQQRPPAQSAQPRQVYLCVIDGPLQGAC